MDNARPACSTPWWRDPRYGGKVTSSDSAAAVKVPGVVRVQIDATREHRCSIHWAALP
jgi:hypothetical protein